MNKSLIIKICEKEFGRPPLKIVKKTEGICNEVYELVYEKIAYIIRMNEEKEWIYGTHKFLPLFRKLKIKVPVIISEDYSKSNMSFCYQIQTKLEGTDLGNVFNDLCKTDLKHIAKEISLIYDKFNTLSYEKSFGGLTGLKEESEDNLLAIIENNRRTILERNNTSHVIENDIIDIHEKLLKQYENYFSKVKPKIYFDDMSSKNVMIHDRKFNGLVDLDFLMKGDYLEGIGGIVAAYYGSDNGDYYINEIFNYQSLSERQKNIAKVYAIFHLILWTSEEGIIFNSNSSGEVNRSKIEIKRKKILDLYSSIQP